MGKRANVTKASLAALFAAAGGATATQAAAEANPDAASIEGIVSSYFGQLGLRDDFEHYYKATGFESFNKFYKVNQEAATQSVLKFAGLNEVPPPPGFLPTDAATSDG